MHIKNGKLHVIGLLAVGLSYMDTLADTQGVMTLGRTMLAFPPDSPRVPLLDSCLASSFKDANGITEGLVGRFVLQRTNTNY